MVEPEVSNIKPKSYSESEYEINQLQDILINSSFNEKKTKEISKENIKNRKKFFQIRTKRDDFETETGAKRQFVLVACEQKISLARVFCSDSRK